MTTRPVWYPQPAEILPSGGWSSSVNGDPVAACQAGGNAELVTV